MAPEALHGGNITCASDLYSLGVVVYELVIGDRPYKGKSRDEIRNELRGR